MSRLFLLFAKLSIDTTFRCRNSLTDAGIDSGNLRVAKKVIRCHQFFLGRRQIRENTGSPLFATGFLSLSSSIKSIACWRPWKATGKRHEDRMNGPWWSMMVHGCPCNSAVKHSLLALDFPEIGLKWTTYVQFLLTEKNCETGVPGG